jgi:hypothetical protein
MIRGYRWIKTAPAIWQFEGPPKSRRFHGQVREHGDGRAAFCLPGGFASYSTVDKVHREHGQGERDTVRAAKDEIEKSVTVAKAEGR